MPDVITVVVAIVAVFVVLVGALLAFAATKPATLHVERATTIKAPPEKIFDLIDDFHRWPAWSPYEKMDLAMKKTYSGAASGKGAVYEWEGNGKVGKGRMEIADTSRPAKVTIKLDFDKPFKCSNVAAFTLEPMADAVNVEWSMDGPNLFMGKVMSVFVDMDKMIGKDFETGLANLKAVAEQ